VGLIGRCMLGLEVERMERCSGRLWLKVVEGWGLNGIIHSRPVQ
jgi:hypothetical protein